MLLSAEFLICGLVSVKVVRQLADPKKTLVKMMLADDGGTFNPEQFSWRDAANTLAVNVEVGKIIDVLVSNEDIDGRQIELAKSQLLAAFSLFR